MQIIADTGPLIGLVKINQLDLLIKLFTKIIIPQEVAQECTEHRSKSGAMLIAQAMQDSLIGIYQEIFPKIVELDNILGKGESAAIALSKQLSMPLLIDDRRGRFFAKKHGVMITGLPGVLLLAKKKNLIQAVKPMLDQLNAHHYHLSSELYNEIVKLAEE